MSSTRSSCKEICNVESLKPLGSPGELAIQLRKWAEEERVQDVAMVIRDPNGRLAVNFTQQKPGELAEMAAWLLAVAQHQMCCVNGLPDIEEVEECGED